MRFAVCVAAIVVAVILAVVTAAPQPDTDNGTADQAAPVVTISLEAVRNGTPFTLDTLLQGGIIGLADASINGLEGVALTDLEMPVGILSHTNAVMLGTIPITMQTSKC